MSEIKIMKYKKKISILFTILLSLNYYHNLRAVLSMSQYKPDSYFQKPYFAQDNFANFSCIYSGGFANSAYNNKSNKVNYLEQFGSEDLLKNFIDPTLAKNNIENFGTGNLSGNFHIRELILSCYKNMQRGFFIEAATVIQDLSINSIKLNFTQELLPATEDQNKYLEELYKKIPSTINQAGMFTTAFYGGFHTTFYDFKHLDFIDFQIKAGIMSPQAMSKENKSILQFPFINNVNFGYPIILTTSIGILDWMTIGYNGAVIPWQSNMTTIAINNTTSQNTLLLSQSNLAIIQRGPLFTTSIYIEADHFHQNLSTLVGYCYTRNSAYQITPIDQINLETNLINQSSLLQPWSLGSFYIEFSIDFACQAKPNAPIVSVFCNIPVSGKLCPETNLFGGTCSLQLSYNF